jgi:hypothetical protein
MWVKFIEICKAILDTLAPLFIAKEWGKETIKRKQAENNAEQMERYEKIDNIPDIKRPFGDGVRHDK